jgi:membrane associated rhomboid family serine protease
MEASGATLFILAITLVASVGALVNTNAMDRLQFNAYAIRHHREWWRFFTYGLIHADWVHLLVNLYVLYSFGAIVEMLYRFHFDVKGTVYYVFLYIGGIMFSVLYDFGKHKEDVHYNAVGASGAVSAVVFASIILYPGGKISLFFIPIGIPSALFGILYLVYSAYMARRSKDNIGHNAHFWGAVFGALFTVALKPSLFKAFVEAIF